MSGHSGHVSALAWRVDGEQLLSGGGVDGTLRVWDVRTGDCISTAVRPAAGRQRAARGLRRAHGATRERANAPTASQEGGKSISALDYSRGARLVAAAHPDHCVRLWDDRASSA